MSSWPTRMLLVTSIACAVGIASSSAAQRDENRQNQGNQNRQKQDRASEAVRSSLSERFPDISNLERIGSSRINGVRVERVRFTTQDGRRGLAHVTEDGHFISAGLSMPLNQAPPDVRRGIESLLKDPPEQVVDSMRTLFVVGVERKGQRNDLVLDATGRLMDVRTQDEINAERNRDVSGQEREKVVQHALERGGVGEGAKATNVYRDADHRGYDVVVLTDAQNQQRRITLNESGQILSTEVKIDAKALPEPVANSLRTLFEGDRIVEAYRMHDHYFQATQDVGDQALTVRMMPAGEVISAFTHRGRGLDGDPMTAGFQESDDRNVPRGKAKGHDKDRAADESLEDTD